MRCACGRLNENGFEVRKVADRMHQARRVSAVLCEATRYISAKGRYALTHQCFTACTVKAGEAWLHGVGCHAVADRYILDICADGGDCACCFMA
jgi:hypothetical protein